MTDTHNPRILIVDDTSDNLDLLEFALQRKPVTMLRAESGKECLRIAQSEQPDVILLDIQMPEMDGYETLKRLRSNTETAKIPVIFLTAQRKDPESIEKGLALGAEEYLTKPIDIEELLVRTQMLIRLKRAEQELEEMKKDFLAMLVHDLRSPIIGIQSAISIVNELKASPTPLLTEDHFRLLESSQNSCNSIIGLIGDLLDLTKYESGHLKIEKVMTDPVEIVSGVLSQMEMLFRQKRINIRLECEEGIPKVSMDAEKITHTLTNLLSNAVKFSFPNSEIEVRLSPLPDSQGKSGVTFSITDHGMGIPEEDIPFIFNRYHQSKNAKMIKQKGTGLGLAICKLIIEAHDGTIQVQSIPKEFTTFTFTLYA